MNKVLISVVYVCALSEYLGLQFPLSPFKAIRYPQSMKSVYNVESESTNSIVNPAAIAVRHYIFYS